MYVEFRGNFEESNVVSVGDFVECVSTGLNYIYESGRVYQIQTYEDTLCIRDENGIMRNGYGGVWRISGKDPRIQGSAAWFRSVVK